MTREDIAIGLAKDPDFKKLAPDRQQAVFESAVQQAGGEQAMVQPSQPKYEQPSPINPYGLKPFQDRELTSKLLPPWSLLQMAYTPQGEAVGQKVRQMTDTAVNAVQSIPGSNTFAAIPAAIRMAGTMAEPKNIAKSLTYGPAIEMAAPYVAAAGQKAAGKMSRGLSRTADFFRGNPEKIRTLNRELEDASHGFVKEFRNGGKLHQQVMNTIERESEAAWQPMKEVTASIQGKINVQDVKTTAATLFQQEPERLAAVNAFLDDMASSKAYKLPVSGRQFGFSAADWSDLSSEVGTFMSRGGIKGTAARTMRDMVNSDIRSVIANIIEQKAPLDMQSNVALAKQQWADYATDRNRLFSIVQPGASQHYTTKTGTGFFKKAATGRLTADEAEFLGRLQDKSGIKLPPEIMKIAKNLNKARAQGDLGLQIRRYGAYGVAGLGAIQAAKEVARQR